MLYQQTHRLRTLRMGKKARSVTIGERGKEAIFITPNPKPVMEFHWWVLRCKIHSGMMAAIAVSLGAVSVVLGWQFVLGLVIVAFLVGFIRGGDVESSPD